MKTIRVAMSGRAMAAGRYCGEFWADATVEYMFGCRRGDLLMSYSNGSNPAIVNVEVDTLEPTDDGNPDELWLCEQAQKGDRT